MDLLEIVGWIALTALAWLWFDGTRAREIAVAASRDACAAEGLQFLDDTVSFRKLWPVRDDDGRLRLQRVYGFEYSDTGDNRRRGSIVLLGHRVIAIHVGLRSVPAGRVLH
ncbi:MAG: DUF3301 domain-containing protein [Betaproteobacteria bacterium]|nr:DUF3301 domain-containing protein [Betaproteobacteria bacterium]